MDGLGSFLGPDLFTGFFFFTPVMLLRLGYTHISSEHLKGVVISQQDAYIFRTLP